jgi:hypothetical protein
MDSLIVDLVRKIVSGSPDGIVSLLVVVLLFAISVFQSKKRKR